MIIAKDKGNALDIEILQLKEKKMNKTQLSTQNICNKPAKNIKKRVCFLIPWPSIWLLLYLDR